MIRRTRTPLLLLALNLLMLFASYRHAAADLWSAWQTDEYSHGVLIPLISLLIGWHIMTAAPARPASSWWSVAALSVSALMLLVAELAAFQTAAHYGFIVALGGFSLAFIGRAGTRALVPAFIYLFFSVPLPHLLYSSLSQDLQLISSTLGVALLELLDISVHQDGNIIDLGGYRLQVVEACSGLRYLFPLLSFGYLMAYLLKDAWWKRAVLLFSAIPITLFMNSFRVGVIGVTVNRWGIEMAEGLVHDLEGWVVFLACVLILLTEAMLLLKMKNSGTFNYEIFGMAQGPALAAPMRITAPVLATTAITALLCAMFGFGLIREREQVIPSHPPFSTFPARIGGWEGRRRPLEPDVLQNLRLSDYVLVDYVSETEKNPVNFYIAYYDTQRVGSSTHSPSSCIPGGGWQIKERSGRTLELGGESITVSRFLIKKQNVSQLVYFWFEERGRVVTETSYAKWHLLVDAITLRRTDGALVRMATPVSSGETAQDADDRLIRFLREARPPVKHFIPGAELTNQ